MTEQLDEPEFSPAIEEALQKYEARYPGLREAMAAFLLSKGRDYLWETELITLMHEGQK